MRDLPPTAPAAASDSRARATTIRWRIFGLSCAASWTLYLHRYIFGLIMPLLADEWHVDKTDLGFMQSAFYIPYVALQIPCGMLVDWLGTHLFLSATVLAWSGVLALHAWAPTPRAMYWVRVAFGIAQAGCYPALGKITQAWFPLSIRTSLQGWIASFSGRFGGASANLLFASLLLGTFGLSWRTSIYLLAAWGAFLAAAIFVVVRNTPREHPQVNAAELAVIEYRAPHNTPAGPATVVDDRVALRWHERISRRSAVNVGFFLLQFFGATFADTVYVVWMPTVLKSVHGVDNIAMGFYSALPLFGGALGGLLGGYINDFAMRRIGRRWARSAIGAAGNAGAAVLVLTALGTFDDYRMFCWVLFGAKIFSDWCQPTTWGTVTDIAGPYAGTIFGLGNGIGGLGAVIAAPLLGYVYDSYDSWHPVFLLIAATYAASSFCWLALNCTIPVLRAADIETRG